MTNVYTWVQWNPHKKRYDIVLALGVLLSISMVLIQSLVLRSDPLDPVVAMMRALAITAVLLLHVILVIGPLCRLRPAFLPLLYNRRHLGVTMALLACAHAILAIGYYGGFGDRNPFAAVLDPLGVEGVPFELLGFAALLVFITMAATSHDFWLANLGARYWKSLHMCVYFAYALVLAHVTAGALQSERSPAFAISMAIGAFVVCSLHLVAGFRGARERRAPNSDWVDVAGLDEIPVDRAAIVTLANGDQVAVFRTDEGSFNAISNVCAHQGGPLGEGKIIGGCVTCPWHGYQYRAHDGCSPPPYTERVETYELRVSGERIELNPTPNAPGTPTQPARTEQGGSG